MSKHGLYGALLYLRSFRFLRRIVYFVLKLLSIEIPVSVQIGRELILVHGGFGVVIHPKATIKDNVRIYPGVTLGRGDVYRPPEESRFEAIVVQSGAIIGTGAKVLCTDGVLVVGYDTVIGANAVLTCSTGDGELWAGIPARKIGVLEARYQKHVANYRSNTQSSSDN